MKAIVGIDGEGHYVSALNALARLAFAECDVELVHASALFMPMTFDAIYGQTLPNPEIQAVLDESADKLLANSSVKAKAMGLVNHTIRQIGDPANILMNRAEMDHAELICVGSEHKGSVEAFLMGSVSRSLTLHSPSSVLVAKEKDMGQTKMTAVLATDGSLDAQKSIDQLIRLRPTGIAAIHLLSVVNAEELTTPEDSTELEWLKSHLKTESAKLRRAGFVVDEQLLYGREETCFHQAMASASADLLILGTHHRGFFENLVAKSKTLHEVVAEDYSVLILKTPTV